MHTHRNQKPIPVDPKERKARVRWLLNHRVWTYPVQTRRPPEGGQLVPPRSRGRPDGSFHHGWSLLGRRHDPHGRT